MPKLNIDLKKFEITSAKKFSLSDFSTSPEVEISKSDSKDIIEENVSSIADFQERMYANQKRSVLIIFQAIDAAGKDGTIERLVTGINPQGVQVNSFKKPTPEELSHDFLWRVQRKLPPRGIIGVFNRSHYEETLVVRVHPEYLMSQHIPGIEAPEDATDELWQRRFKMIRNFEQNLVDTGTLVLKFFLYVSKDEQKKRLLDRIKDEDKHWKFKIDDINERPHWKEYLHAFEEAIANTASPDCPWFIIPADDKNTMRAIVSSIVEMKLQDFKEDWPTTNPSDLEDIKLGKSMLQNEN